ncbi:MAG: hypothetical protein V1921_06555 [Candidatus Altiarchaeota archaeon]
MTGTKVIKLKLEEGSGEKLPALKDPVVEGAAALYRSMEMFPKYDYGDQPEERYQELLGMSVGLNVTPVQVQRIIERLEQDHSEEEYYADKAGLLLTALVQGSKSNEFEFTAKKKLNYLGFMLEEGKTVKVNGDLGERIGRKMRGGSIDVSGSVGDEAGWEMRGGEITIGKDAGDWTGFEMHDGRIHVKGNTDGYAGSGMYDGEIQVDGNAGRKTAEGKRGGVLDIKGDVASWGDKIGREISPGIFD